MSDVNSSEFWDGIYQRGSAPWDLGGPTPVFRRLLESGQYVPGRMMVLGAGRGHDARMFARYGFEVTAVDFAAEAAQEMRALADPQAPVEILHSDIFELPSILHGTFDYLLEYTCLCALDPQRRADYADLISRLIKPGGTYIALLFPNWDRAGGPPFAVSPAELSQLFFARGFDLRLREDNPVDSVPFRREFESLLIFDHKDRVAQRR